ncbi:MAG: dihydroorotate dehydrogenase [Candidatus Omnitrophica bacterium]|nr:dihydroorotate dehydrogenase [Candidatus Omnitrophota bacterium]
MVTTQDKLQVKIGNLELKNPVILASGTCGFGSEIKDFADTGKLGGIVTKTITLTKREGNPPPRVFETTGGLLNSIGLDNDGFKNFVFEKVSGLEKLRTTVIASIAGNTVGEFVKLVTGLSGIPVVGAIELNLSCPNVIHKGTRFNLLSQDEKAVKKIISKLRGITQKTLIAKLSPNVTDIKKIARAAETAGIDAISLINTYPGLAADIHTMKPRLGGVTGGLSGPAIKPLALKCVWDVYRSVGVPIIGAGGIMTWEDAVEFMICGAAVVQVGTANFVNPKAPFEITEGIKKYMKAKKIKSVKDIVGTLKA